MMFGIHGSELHPERVESENRARMIRSIFITNATYEISDAMDDAAYRLFSRLDLDSNGKLEIKLDENNLDVDTITISDVPSLWGPAIIEVRVW